MSLEEAFYKLPLGLIPIVSGLAGTARIARIVKTKNARKANFDGETDLYFMGAAAFWATLIAMVIIWGRAENAAGLGRNWGMVLSCILDALIFFVMDFWCYRYCGYGPQLSRSAQFVPMQSNTRKIFALIVGSLTIGLFVLLAIFVQSHSLDLNKHLDGIQLAAMVILLGSPDFEFGFMFLIAGTTGALIYAFALYLFFLFHSNAKMRMNTNG